MFFVVINILQENVAMLFFISRGVALRMIIHPVLLSPFYFRLVLIHVFYSAQLRFEFIKNMHQTPDAINERGKRIAPILNFQLIIDNYY